MALKFGTSGIRGLNTDFTAEAVDAFIDAFITQARLKLDVVEVAVGNDLRQSTPSIYRMVESSLHRLKVKVINCGNLPTPALALHCQDRGIPGLMITGSHIPADRNGIKFYWPWGEILKSDEAAIFNCVSEAAKSTATLMGVNGGSTLDESRNAIDRYIERYVQFFDKYKNAFKNKTIVVYQHSSVGRDLWRPILTALGCHVIEVGRSSTFVPVDTETDEAVTPLKFLLEENQIKDFWAVVSSDGDSDRPFVCDENLNMVRGDTLGLVTAAFLKVDVVVTPITSNTALEKSGWVTRILRTKIGSPFVIEAMNEALQNSEKGSVSSGLSDLAPSWSIQNQMVLGYEANGGVLLGSNMGGSLTPLPTRDAVLPVLCLLASAGLKNIQISELVRNGPQRFTASGLLRDAATEKAEKIYQAIQRERSFEQEFIKHHGRIKAMSDLDGLRLEFEDESILHFRPSGNAPEFRCYSEAATPERASAMVEKGLVWLKRNLENPS